MNNNIKLIGDDYSKEQVMQWYKDEAEWHNKFIGGRSKEYNIYDDIVNQKIFFNDFLNDGKLLDFGCAEGLMLKRFHSKRNALYIKYYGIDSSWSLPTFEQKRAFFSSENDKNLV